MNSTIHKLSLILRKYWILIGVCVSIALFFILKNGIEKLFTVPENRSIAVHIIVMRWDSMLPLNALQNSFNPEVGKNVRMKSMARNTVGEVESSGLTNKNGLALLTLENPVLDRERNTQDVEISIDGIGGIVRCKLSPFAQGYYYKEIYIDTGSIRFFYPN